MSSRIHLTALISPDAELADDVQIGAHVIIEGRVKIGPGCVIKTHAYLIGPLTMGRGNTVFSRAVLGERPQHSHYQDEATGVEIGEHNVFREQVTVGRGTTQAWTTKIGSGNYFMVNSHVGHDCQVGNRCTMANGALLGGHCQVGDGAFLSYNAAAHQFVRIGRLALLGSGSYTSKDMPPYAMQQRINVIEGVNIDGMRSAGMNSAQIQNVELAYHVLFLEGLPLPTAMIQVEQTLGTAPEVAELITFIRGSVRGINRMPISPAA